METLPSIFNLKVTLANPTQNPLDPSPLGLTIPANTAKEDQEKAFDQDQKLPSTFFRFSSNSSSSGDLFFVLKAGETHIMVQCQSKFKPNAAISKWHELSSDLEATHLPHEIPLPEKSEEKWIRLHLVVICHKSIKFSETGKLEKISDNEYVVGVDLSAPWLVEFQQLFPGFNFFSFFSFLLFLFSFFFFLFSFFFLLDFLVRMAWNQ